jgi:hypothetical protein
MDGIENAQAKLAWAQAHLELLDLEIEKFLESGPYTLTAGEDLEHERYVLRFTLLEVPGQISLIAGDAICNMRSSLDQLVWSLARLKGIPERTAFPILDGPVLTKDKLRSFNNSLKDVPQGAICEIAALQPHHRGADYKKHPLWRLNEICNLDKHRRIPANGSASVLHFPNLAPGEEKTVLKIDVTETGYIISAPIALKHKLELHDRMQFTVNFGGDISGISETFRSLDNIRKFIAESVLPRFEGFFNIRSSSP